MSPFAEIAGATRRRCSSRPAARVSGTAGACRDRGRLDDASAAARCAAFWVTAIQYTTAATRRRPARARGLGPWSKYRGPGAVTFDKARPELQKLRPAPPFNAKADATVKFAEPANTCCTVTATTTRATAAAASAAAGRRRWSRFQSNLAIA